MSVASDNFMEVLKMIKLFNNYNF